MRFGRIAPVPPAEEENKVPASRRPRGGRPRDASLDARILSETCALLAARGFRGLRID